MLEKYDDDIHELTPSMYNNSLNIITKKPGNKYNIITKGGQSFHDALYNLFYTVWSSEVIPEEWHKSTLIQLYKGAGAGKVNSL